MSILDDAIREHLELKRAHGADEAELKKLEDEAFGPPGRPEEPDPFAEAPTEFMATEAPEGAEPTEEDDGRRRINIADLQEPPPPEAAEQREEPRVEAVPEIEPQAEATPITPAEDAVQAAPPAEEPPVVDEAEARSVADEAEEPAGGERQEIAEQPTELFDVEAEMGSEAAPAAEAPSPSDEQIVEAEREEPRLVPVADDEEDEEDDEFWNEQRLSDELDHALEAPLTEEHPLPPAPAPEEQDSEEHEHPKIDYDPDTGHEDVLEDTPEFLEESPEDDELWFEQKPPKDFDFDD